MKKSSFDFYPYPATFVSGILQNLVEPLECRRAVQHSADLLVFSYEQASSGVFVGVTDVY